VPSNHVGQSASDETASRATILLHWVDGGRRLRCGMIELDFDCGLGSVLLPDRAGAKTEPVA